jgi:hypothetical protein
MSLTVRGDGNSESRVGCARKLVANLVALTRVSDAILGLYRLNTGTFYLVLGNKMRA